MTKIQVCEVSLIFAQFQVPIFAQAASVRIHERGGVDVADRADDPCVLKFKGESKLMMASSDSE